MYMLLVEVGEMVHSVMRRREVERDRLERGDMMKTWGGDESGDGLAGNAEIGGRRR